MSDRIEGLYDDLSEWGRSHDIPLVIHGWRNGARKVIIAGTISVEFADTLPLVVVEWGDGYRGDFSHGLPSAALIGLVAGFLGVPAKETCQ